MTYYRQVGDVPPKRHTQFRDAGGRAVLRGADGGGGLLLGLLAALPPRGAVGDRRRQRLGAAPTCDHAEPPAKPRHLKLHDLFGERRRRHVDPVTGRRLVLGNGDVRISYVVAERNRRRYYRNAVGDECVYVESGTGVVETVFGALTYRQGDYVMVPRATTHRWVPRRRASRALYAIEANSHIAPPKRYLSRFGQLLEHAPYCERDLHGPGEPLRRRRARTSRCWSSTAAADRRHRRHPDDLRHAPVRRGRLGRLPVPVHVQRRGLHADHRQGPPAAAGAPGLRGLQLRGLQLPAAQGRLPPAVDPGARTTTPTSTATRSCSTSAATTRPARARASASARSRCTRAATPTGRSRARSRRSLGAEYFDELAVMVDTFRPLDLGEGGLAVEDPAYAWTWAGRHI